MWEILLATALTVVAFFTGISAYAPAAILSASGPELPPPASKVEILFGGDVMLDRALRIAADARGEDFLFSCISDTFARPDKVVVNLEGPVTSNPSKSVGSVVGSPENFTFTFATTVAATLKRHHIDIVSLGNNHILNQGRDGVRQTEKYLKVAGVAYFGDPLSDTVHTERIKDIPFAFVAYNEFGGSASTTLAQIRKARAQGSMVVVYTHWGDEYKLKSHPRQQDLAHQFIDAGAEIVIGSHSHVIQEREQYKGKYIYYSLGNLFFDQYWEDAVRTGLLVTVTFGPEGVLSVSEQESYLERDRRTCIKK